MNENIIKFLRDEAKKIYKGLPLEMRVRTTKQKVFSKMKNTWRAGNKLKPEIRKGVFDNDGS